MKTIKLNPKEIVEFYRSYDEALGATTYFWKYGLIAVVAFTALNVIT
ncbi:hypothetical protein [Vibrio crassostreae]|nr:hypothetical protein [Vibrio crassostreae]